MQLRVALTSDALGEDDVDEVVHNFTDLDRISARCARAIKQFIRDTPVRASLHRTNFLVTAQWLEAERNTHTQTRHVPGGVNAQRLLVTGVDTRRKVLTVTARPRPKRKKKARK